MANSLRAKLSKLRHDGNITDVEYQKLIAKLDGHDKEVRAKAIDKFVEKLKHEFDENIFSDEEKFKYDRKTQEAICAQNATWKVALQYVDKVAKQLKEDIEWYETHGANKGISLIDEAEARTEAEVCELVK